MHMFRSLRTIIFISFLFLSFKAFALNAEDWIEDREAISAIITSHRTHYTQETIKFNCLSKKAPQYYTPEMSEYQKLTEKFVKKLGTLQKAWDATEYDIDKITDLLRAPFEAIQEFSALSQNQPVCKDFVNLMRTVHYTAQQYFQQESNRIRKEIRQKTDEEAIISLHQDDPLGLKSYFKEKLATEKYMLWLPSHLKHIGIYLDKISRYEKQIGILTQAIQDGRKTAQLIIENAIQTIIKPTILTQTNPMELLLKEMNDLKSLKRKEKMEEDPQKMPMVFQSQQSNNEAALKINKGEESEDEDENEEIKQITKENEKQYQQDRRQKLITKKNEVRKNKKVNEVPQNNSGQSKTNLTRQLRDHPVLLEIYNLNPRIKTENFIGFFTEAGFKITENLKSYTVWFSENLCKSFHRPHTAGGVIPFMDIKIAKRALKTIGLEPEKKTRK